MLWALEPHCVDASVAAAARHREAVAKGEVSASHDAALLPGHHCFATLRGDVAVIPVRGLLQAHFSYFAWSYEELARDVAAAVSHPDVRRVVLDIDSPGGVTTGLSECAQMIARANTSKPVVAMIRGSAASAAYWLACAAGETVAAPSALVGSVGVVLTYSDMKPLMERMGIRVLELAAAVSPDKRANPIDDEDERARLQRICDVQGEQFAAAVAKARRIAPEDVPERFGGGALFAATDALDRGMVDRIAEMYDVAPRAGVTPTTETEDTMPDTEIETTEAVAGTSVPTIPAAPAGGSAQAADGRLTDGVAAERERVSAILAAAGGQHVVAQECIADGSTVEASLARILKAERAQNAAALDTIAAADEGGEVVPVIGVGADNPGKVEQTPDGWRAEFAASEALQGEFMSADHYVAFKKHERED